MNSNFVDMLISEEVAQGEALLPDLISKVLIAGQLAATQLKDLDIPIEIVCSLGTTIAHRHLFLREQGPPTQCLPLTSSGRMMLGGSLSLTLRPFLLSREALQLGLWIQTG